MTRTFDATDNADRDFPAEDTPPAHYDSSPEPAPLAERHSMSSLDMLQQSITEREEAERTLHPVEIPGLDVRLMCDKYFDAEDWTGWQKLAIPKNKRRKPGPADINQKALFTTVLVETCQHLEFKRADGWEPICGSDGEPLGLKSDELLTRFGQMTARSMVEKLFELDGHIIRAGMTVVAAAGFGDESDELAALEDAKDGDENPTR